MNVCIVGEGLISLTLAKALVNEGIEVDILSNQKSKQIHKSRTLSISKNNINFFNKNILNINNLLWKINKIEIYSDNLIDEKILNFENSEENLFSIVKNYDLYSALISSLKKNKLFKIKQHYKKIKLDDYKLIINCDFNSHLSKKFFFREHNKDYNSRAFTGIIYHEKFKNNNTAVQIFTKKGPLAFLPISSEQTSIVYSIRSPNNISFLDLIKKYNKNYKIIKIDQISNFELKGKILRNYHYKNVLAFGDLLHKLHPLAGQGYNMSIRDIQFLLKLIRFKQSLGLDLDSSICFEFEKKLKHKNYLFSSGIDFVYEFFNLESKINNPLISKSVKFLGQNKYINKVFTKFADDGLAI